MTKNEEMTLKINEISRNHIQSKIVMIVVCTRRNFMQ